VDGTTNKEMLRARHLALGLAVLLAVAVDSNAHSQEAAPSKSENVSPPQSQPSQANQTARPDERGTEQAPLVVKVLPAAESEEKAAADAAREDKKAANDDRLTTFTEWLFGATAALSVIAFFQLLVFAWQGFQLQRTVAATLAATELARQEFVATHRPKLIVRDVAPMNTASNNRVEIRYSIVNVGDSRGRVVQSDVYVEFFPEMAPMIVPTLANDKNDLEKAIGEPIILQGGQSKMLFYWTDHFTWDDRIKSDFGTTSDIWKNRPAQYVGLFFVGHIIYADDNGTLRHTAFRRRYEARGQRFYPISDAEHEYAD
jgi:hypothetical protein